MLVTDPPYGIDLKNHGRNDGRRRRSDFAIIGDSDPVAVQTILDLFGSGPRIVFASPMRAWAGAWSQFLVWDKGPAVGGGGNPGTHWKFTWELIQVSGLGKLGGIRDEAVLRHWVTPATSREHIAAKPLSLMKYLICKAPPTGYILDPFMGSGSTLRAAKDTGRRAIGIEIEERYCEIAAKRLSQEVLPLG